MIRSTLRSSLNTKVVLFCFDSTQSREYTVQNKGSGRSYYTTSLLPQHQHQPQHILPPLPACLDSVPDTFVANTGIPKYAVWQGSGWFFLFAFRTRYQQAPNQTNREGFHRPSTNHSSRTTLPPDRYPKSIHSPPRRRLCYSVGMRNRVRDENTKSRKKREPISSAHKIKRLQGFFSYFLLLSSILS